MLFIGLGNPGDEYEQTRHNIGFEVVRCLAQRWGLKWKKERKFMGWIASGRCGERKVDLLLPATYMNESGRAVGAYAHFLSLPPIEMLVVSDDADLPFGTLRLRVGGGHGGHNGLRSLIEHLGTKEFPRLRVGIGRQEGDLTAHVLGRFSAEERQHLGEVIERAADACEAWLHSPGVAVMDQLNRSVEEEK
ncbi:MAG: aminoacyl-tRNA hydrolase [Verrucomicrobia bacterium]|nr:aminoacyl-tRNA hydrolase [Verrucomicrobiota bacterium]